MFIRGGGTLRRALLGCFQDAMSGNSYKVLMSLKQLAFVVEFIKKFELISSPLGHADEEILKGDFMNRLKEEIRAEVCLHGVGDLGSTMKLARNIEEKNKVLGHSDGPGKKFSNRHALSNQCDGTGNWSSLNCIGNRSQGLERTPMRDPNPMEALCQLCNAPMVARTS